MPTKKTKNETIHAGKNEKKKKQIRTGGEGEIAGIVKRKKKEIKKKKKRRKEKTHTGGEGEIAGIVERKALDSAEHNAARQDARHEPMAQVKTLKSQRL